jgi:hypothetical protein
MKHPVNTLLPGWGGLKNEMNGRIASLLLGCVKMHTGTVIENGMLVVIMNNYGMALNVPTKGIDSTMFI